MTEPPLQFAAIGLEHRHIYHQVGRLLELGCDCAGFWTDGDPRPLSGFLERFPHLPRVDDPDRFLENPGIRLIVSAAIPDERAGIAVQAMQQGKGVMVDKPGVVSLEQLAEVQRVQAETGRIWSIDFSERFEVRAMTRAAGLIEAGAIGEIVHLTGFGPHRLNRPTRPPWFFEPSRTGGFHDGPGPGPRRGRGAERLGVPGFATMHDLLSDGPEIEAVDICAAPPAHAPLIETAAAAAGKHILVEKPLCHSPSQARAIVDAVERHGVRLMVGYMRRFDDIVFGGQASA